MNLVRYVICLLGLIQTARAQPMRYGNEWLNPAQTYYKMPVAQNATFRLTTANLQQAGLPVGSLNPQAVQVFWRGREQAIIVTGEADGRFDAADYVEFTGQPSDGVPDSALYVPGAQPHPFYSLFSDTTAYFLTWRVDGGRGLRATLPVANNARYVPAEVRRVLTDTYPPGNIYPMGAGAENGAILTNYDVGEGWTGPVIQPNATFTQTLIAPGAATDTADARLELLLVGRSPTAHSVRIQVGGQPPQTVQFDNYATYRFTTTLRSADLSAPLAVSITPTGAGDQMSVSYYRLLYWQRSAQYAGPPQPALPVLTPPLRRVTLRSLDPRRANYLIVTHPALRQPVGGQDAVLAYATYRRSAAGGGFDTLSVNIEELFNQFSFGERNALAIRRFADFMASGGRQPTLFLVGQSRDPQGVRKNPDAARLDMVPNAGWPGSDLALVSGLNGQPDNVPGLPVGRLNVTQPQQVLNYLAKVRAHETADTTRNPLTRLWRKRILHLSGGRSVSELALFRGLLNSYGTVAQRPWLGGLLQTVQKQTDASVEAIPIDGPINQGVGLMTLFGHSSLDVTDLDIGLASDDRRGYRNAGRYPLLLFFGCAVGNFYFGRPTLASDWVQTPGRGGIAAIAHTYNGYVEPLHNYATLFYSVLADSAWVNKSIGQIQKEVIRRFLAQDNSVFSVTTAQQLTLQGDPAVRPFPFDRPDFGWATASYQATPNRDSVRISSVALNYARAMAGQLPLRVRFFGEGGRLLSEQRLTVAAPLVADTLRMTLPANVAALRYATLTLDPDAQFDEPDEQNNQLTINASGPLDVLPFPTDQTPPILDVAVDGQRLTNNELVAAQPTLTVLVKDENLQLLRSDTTGLALFLQRPCGQPARLTDACVFQRLSLRSARFGPADANNQFRLTLQLPQALPDGEYALEARATDLSGNVAAPYRIQFRVQRSAAVLAADVSPNPFFAETRFRLELAGGTAPDAVEITVWNAAGQLVWHQRPTARVGLNEWTWSGVATQGTDAGGQRLPGGLYHYRITVQNGGQPLPLAGEGQIRLTGKLLLAR